MNLNITNKLILIVVILVVIPVLATGIVAYQASTQIVTQLLNQSQITLAREIAQQASELFRTARLDTKMLSALPAISDYYYNQFYSLHSESEISRKQIENYFLDMGQKSKFYYGISYVSADGRQIVYITQGKIVNMSAQYFDPITPIAGPNGETDSPHISSVITVEGKRRTVKVTQPLTDVWGNLSGYVVLELDFDRITDQILKRRVGKKGYAMVIDTDGRLQIHPNRDYWGKGYDELKSPSVTNVITTMLRESQGMITYDNDGSKVAAYTPVEENGWVVAVTVPRSEFSESANIIRARVLLIVLLSLSITVAVGIIFSWRFVRPIKELALATNVISSGRLPKKIELTSSDELGILTRSFNHMVRNLRQIQAELVKSEKLSSLGRLATGVAHEIRNPLNSIKVAAEVLGTRNPSAEEADDLIKLIHSEVLHLDNFVRNFLSYARQPPPKFTDVDVNELIEDIVHTQRLRFEKNKIDVDLRLEPNLPMTLMDPFQMERALLNIIINSIDAMPNAGRLRIKTRNSSIITSGGERTCVLIEVADTGVGLLPDQLDHIFDPFFTTKEYGTGLGLSLTKSIIEAHGGQINIEAGPSKGIIVTIRLNQIALNPKDEESDETLQDSAG